MMDNKGSIRDIDITSNTGFVFFTAGERSCQIPFFFTRLPTVNRTPRTGRACKNSTGHAPRSFGFGSSGSQSHSGCRRPRRRRRSRRAPPRRGSATL